MMFWRSVVGKLAVTILLLVSFVLFILTILLLEFFEGYHIQEAKKDVILTATKISQVVDPSENRETTLEMVEAVKDPSSKVFIHFTDGYEWFSYTTNSQLNQIETLMEDEKYQAIIDHVMSNNIYNETLSLAEQNREIIAVGIPLQQKQGAIFVFQSLDIIKETRAETTKIIFVAAAIAIVLTTVFAFFLSTRITRPLIKMREAATDVAKGEFNTKVPVLTHDEIGELAITFNRMANQLRFHMNALRQEKEQLSSLVSSMADGVITLTRDGEITVLNPPAEQFMQDLYFNHNISQNRREQILPDRIHNVLRNVLEQEKEISEEIYLNGRYWLLVMTPLYDENRIRGAVAVIRDMTEERQLDKLRKDFIANVSHELRTPIALMRGYSEAIVDDIAETVEEKNELAGIIHEEALRMERLVNELLDIGRIEAGHIELNIEHVDIEQYIDRIYKKFLGMAEEQQITLKVTKDIHQKMVAMDPDRIEQVFTNLISNAFGHTKPGGYVHIRARSDERVFYVEVEDSGSGIPEEDLMFIFERFYKADKSRTRSGKRQGTGLGLAITKHLIEAHGGTISVKSKVGVGTTFRFKIPQDQA